MISPQHDDWAGVKALICKKQGDSLNRVITPVNIISQKNHRFVFEGAPYCIRSKGTNLVDHFEQIIKLPMNVPHNVMRALRQLDYIRLLDQDWNGSIAEGV